MNKTIALAGALSLALTAIHVFGGGNDVHVPLLQTNASDVLKGFTSVIWHAVTANMLICTGMLFIAAKNKHQSALLAGLVIANYLSYVGLFVFYGITRFSSLFVMVPWIGFLIISVVTMLGIAFQRRQNLSMLA